MVIIKVKGEAVGMPVAQRCEIIHYNTGNNKIWVELCGIKGLADSNKIIDCKDIIGVELAESVTLWVK